MSWSYWLSTLSIVLSFTCQVLVLVNQTLNCGSLESGSKRTRLNSSMKSNKMFLNEKTASQVTTRSNLLSIEPIEVNDDLLAKCDYNIGKIPKLDSKLFFIDNEYLKCFDSDGANKCLSDEMLFDSGKNLEKSILLDSDNQLNYIHKLENMLNELYSSSAKNTLKSENHDFDMIKKSQRRSSEKMFNTLSLPNLNEITNYLIENNSEKTNH